MWLGLAWTFSVVTLIAAILAQFHRWSSRFVLTGRRVVLKNGVLRQRSTESPLRNVESVLVEFPILGRLFNSGTLTEQESPHLSRALVEARNRPDDLLRVSATARSQDEDVAISAAQEAIKGRPSAQAQLALAYALELKGLPNDATLLREAETAARASVAANPTAFGYAELGDILREESNQSGARNFYLEALELDRKSPNKDLEAQVYRGLSIGYDETGTLIRGSVCLTRWCPRAKRLFRTGWDAHGVSMLGLKLTAASLSSFGPRPTLRCCGRRRGWVRCLVSGRI